MKRRHGQRGQAAVEAAITLPLVLFMILGTMQLFLALQARILAQYAIGRAVRQGSLHHANCKVMRGAAVATLIPAISPFARPGASRNQKITAYIRRVRDLRNGANFTYSNLGIPNYRGDVVWLDRVSPLAGDISGQNIEDTWDLPPPEGTRFELAARMIFWYPMRIPFANWVIARAVLAAQGMQNYGGQNPYMVTQNANWTQEGAGAPADAVRMEFQARVNRREYVLPIQTSAVTRMMSPPRAVFLNQPCTF